MRCFSGAALIALSARGSFAGDANASSPKALTVVVEPKPDRAAPGQRFIKTDIVFSAKLLAPVATIFIVWTLKVTDGGEAIR